MAKVKANAGKKGPAVHMQRYFLHQAGMGIEQIASEQGVTKETVLGSIQKVDAYKLANTMEVMRPALIESVLGRKEKVDKALDEALDAKRVGKDGVDVPDHDRRLKAVAEFRELVKVAIPKTPGRGVNVAVHNNQQTAVSSQIPGGVRYEGYEERLRMIRKNVDQHNELPPPESVAAPLGEDEFDLDEEVPDGDSTNTPG